MSFTYSEHNSTRAPFIVIEGVDGSGKTTQVRLLVEWLQTQGYSVILTREPGGTQLAEQLRKIILNPAIPCSDKSELMLLVAARAQHVVEVIIPACENGQLVLSDRFALSSLAYQGYGRGLPLDAIRQMNAIATNGIQPSITCILDISIDDLQLRIGERQDRFEGEGREFLLRVIEGYRTLAKTEPAVHLLDGTRAINEVQDALRQLIALTLL